MNAPTAGLSLAQAPPIAVPFRFFLTAPIFLLAAAGVLLWSGPDAFAWRASPAALATTHLVTLGFMAMVMLGAVMQMLPVLAAAPVPHARIVAAVVHAALTLGAAALAAGFLFGRPWLMKAAAWLLGAAFAVFVVAVALALVRAARRSATMNGVAYAVAALIVTAVLGLALAAMHAWGTPLANLAIRALHPAWGLLGWTGMLVASVAFQVVPMFQMTPQYPRAMMHWFVRAAFVLLLAWSVAAWFAAAAAQAALMLVLVSAYVAFAVATLVLQHRRRRRQPDATLAFWRIGMTSAAVGCAMWALRSVLSEGTEALDVAIGVTALAGFAVSVISGMLYKIVPFLAWFHLQSEVGPRAAPHMKKILADAPQRVHVAVHALAVVLLIAAAIWPQPLIYAGALALAASAAILLRNIAIAALRYRSVIRPALRARSASASYRR